MHCWTFEKTVLLLQQVKSDAGKKLDLNIYLKNGKYKMRFQNWQQHTKVFNFFSNQTILKTSSQPTIKLFAVQEIKKKLFFIEII